jgi:hypothetical protein
LKNRYIISVIAVVLASLMVSTATVPVAATTHGWHTKTMNINAYGYYNFYSKKIQETSRYEYWSVEWDMEGYPGGYYPPSDMEHVTLTMLVRVDKGSDQGQILSFTFKGDDLCFIGKNGKVTFDLWDGTYWYDDYEISGSLVGSYGPNSRFGDAFIRGTISIGDYYYDYWIWIEMQVTVRYYVA